MSATYRAIEISKPGVFTEVRRPLQEPGLNQVRIRVEACGVCHTDSLLVEGALTPWARMSRPVPWGSEWVLESAVDGMTPAFRASEETLSTARTVCSPAS